MNPKLFDFTLRRWKWHHLPEDIAAKLSEHASADELVCVKLTDTRAVYKFEDLYIKVSGSYRFKSQLYPAAKQEFRAYRQLVKNNIAAVEHLGWGRAGHYTALVTRAWSDDAEDALTHWYKLLYQQQDTTDFLQALADFLTQTIDSNLHHGDFHLGNILYSPSLKRCTLVDLHNVSVGKKLTMQERAKMLRVLVELRSGLRPQKIMELYWQIGAIDEISAAAEIHKKLVSDMERANNDWQRRMKQFLKGYAKFSDFVSYNGTVLLVQRNKLRCNLFEPAAAARNEYRTVRLSFAAAMEQMLFSFYLSLLQVPHIPVAAVAPDGTLYYSKLPEEFCEPRDREWINSFSEYLLCMGLHLQDYKQWRRKGNLLLLADFSSMIPLMPDREMFRPADIDPHSWRICKR